MITPPHLKKGDTIAIVAPGRKIDFESISLSVEILRNHGFQVVLGKNLFSIQHSYLSGNDVERLSDLQTALDNANLKAILFARGGYGSTRILDQVDFSRFQKNPKWLCGFSDITALHLKLQTLGVESIHSTMPILFPKAETQSSIDSLVQILTGERQPLQSKPVRYNRLGKASGVLVGGNLSLIVDSLGTASEIDTVNKILLIEEVDEYLYKVDRMMVQLKRAGKLNNLAGLVIGYMTDMKDTELPFGETIENIILNQTKEFNYPIAFGFPFGHQNPNLAWAQGCSAELLASNEMVTLQYL